MPSERQYTQPNLNERLIRCDDSVAVQLMWHAHLARDFTGGTPVPLSVARFEDVAFAAARVQQPDRMIFVDLFSQPVNVDLN